VNNRRSNHGVSIGVESLPMILRIASLLGIDAKLLRETLTDCTSYDSNSDNVLQAIKR
jgi:hypothetical protein